MASVMPRLRSVTLLVGALLATLTLTACEETGVDAVVTGIVDGDTIDVEYDGQEQRVRLLNIDTPETVDPDVDPECLGPEATEFLESRIPPGTEVRLEADEEPKDQYGRFLAGVFLGETLINAEIARAGLGAAVLYEPNSRFYDDVLSAQEEARAAERGLYDPNAECTLPAQLAATTASADEVTAAAPTESASLENLQSYGEELVAAIATVELLAEVFDGDRSRFPLVAFPDGDLARMRGSVQDRSDTLHQLSRDNEAAVQAEESRLAEAQRQAEEEAERRAAAEEAERRAAAEEAERQAAEEEAERAAAQREAAAAAERERQRERDRQAEQSQSSGSAGSAGSSDSSESSGSSGGYDGYTGCRAYGGNYPPNAVDEQGRPYTKIDCSSKTPIG